MSRPSLRGPATSAGPGSAPVIAVDHATFGYADAAVVRDVSLTVAPGEVVALLGANGSGKSTLVRGILGLSEQLGGRVRLFGVPREDFRDFPRLGYVPQRHTLSASVRATVEEIVEVGLLSQRRWWQPRLGGAGSAQMISRCLEVVGLADRAGADVSTLSGGQQRRVLIARAMASRPDILLMDEPTAGVDAANQEVLAGVLSRLAAQGTTMLIVTHELEALNDTVTRIVAMSAGRIVFDGPPAQFQQSQARLLVLGHAHHQGDEVDHTTSRLAATPAAGPLDPQAGEHRG
jgi:zinc transport system ATP-binding protein